MAKKKTNEELLQELTQQGQQVTQANTDYLADQEEARKEQLKANQEQLKATQEAAKAREQSVADQLLKVHQDALDAKQKGAIEEKVDKARTAYTGVTEMLTGLTNLIGVGNGATNQTATNYSKDWMVKADENRKARESRTESYKERRRALQTQLDDLKANNISTLADLRAKHASEDIQAKDAIASNKAKAAADAYDINSTLVNAQMRQNNDIRDYAFEQSKYKDRRQDALNTDTMRVILQGEGGAYNPYDLPISNVAQIVSQFGTPEQVARWSNTQDNSIRATIAQEVANNAEAAKMLKAGSTTLSGSGFDMSKLGL